MIRRLGPVLCLLTFLGTADAQERLRRDYWKTEFLPLIYGSTSRGLFAGGRFHVYAPVPYDWPEINAADFSIKAVGSTTASYDIEIDAHIPAWISGWRLRATAGLNRDTHLAYHGLGNASTADEPFSGPDVFDVRRRVLYARLDLQRKIIGPFRALGGVLFRRSEYDAISDQTVFAADRTAGVITEGDLTDNVTTVRAGLVVDTRDNELDPRTGVFSEVLVSGNGDFTRISGHLRGYVALGSRLRLASRIGGERMSGAPPFAELSFFETSERSLQALGGYGTHRGISINRYVDADKLIASADVRYMIIGFRSIAELSVYAFVDAGRVFPARDFSLTTDGLHWGGGGGLALRIGRNILLAFSLAGGPDGLRIHGGPGWSY